ncbi:MAG: hypothetical protein K9L68_08495 [Spirochaetales bacterium]|nr:hypothetical protein [Spirochaetales bacterium]MCF7938623.1 hypothetical protein [Spirochaetales bacterium]
MRTGRKPNRPVPPPRHLLLALCTIFLIVLSLIFLASCSGRNAQAPLEAGPAGDETAAEGQGREGRGGEPASGAGTGAGTGTGTGTAPGSLEQEGKQQPAEAVVYLLEEDGPRRIEGFDRAAGKMEKVEFRPWMNQVLVRSWYNTNGRLYLFANTVGVFQLELPGSSGNELAFRLLRGSSGVDGRTFSSPVRSGSRIYFSAYKDSYYSRPSTSKGVSLHALDLREEANPEQSPEILPLQGITDIALTSYQAVALQSAPSQDIYITWKQSGREESSFRYTRYDPAGDGFREVSFERLQEAAYPSPLSMAPPELQVLVERAAEDAGTSPSEYLVKLHRPDMEGAQRYAQSFRPEKDSDRMLRHAYIDEYGCILPEGNTLYLQDPIASASRGSVRALELPRLPEEGRYLEPVSLGKRILVSWEEQRFPQVGRAGFVIIMP